MVFYIKQSVSRKTILRNARGQRGAPPKRLAGSWVSDLAALGKAIILCERCNKKWVPAKAGYASKRLWPGAPDYVVSNCDGCGEMGRGTLYLPEKGD